MYNVSIKKFLVLLLVATPKPTSWAHPTEGKPSTENTFCNRAMLGEADIFFQYVDYELSLDEPNTIIALRIKDWIVGQGKRVGTSTRKTVLTQLPYHKKSLEFYFQLLGERRDFSKSRLSLFRKIEKSIPLYRQRLTVIQNKRTSEVIGMIRVFNASRYHYVLNHSAHETEPDTIKLSMDAIDDQNYLSPYERSVRNRGANSTLLQELREANPRTEIYELGRAFRQNGTVQGEEAKAIWELLTAGQDIGESAFSNMPSYYLIHTDRAGARLFQKEYLAQVKEVVIPFNQGGYERVKLIRQNKILPTDSDNYEYGMLVEIRVFLGEVIKRFKEEPLRIKMLEQMPWLKFHFEDIQAMHAECYQQSQD
jgi:hypothetical protein